VTDEQLSSGFRHPPRGRPTRLRPCRRPRLATREKAAKILRGSFPPVDLDSPVTWGAPLPRVAGLGKGMYEAGGVPRYSVVNGPTSLSYFRGPARSSRRGGRGGGPKTRLKAYPRCGRESFIGGGGFVRDRARLAGRTSTGLIRYLGPRRGVSGRPELAVDKLTARNDFGACRTRPPVRPTPKAPASRRVVGATQGGSAPTTGVLALSSLHGSRWPTPARAFRRRFAASAFGIPRRFLGRPSRAIEAFRVLGGRDPQGSILTTCPAIRPKYGLLISNSEGGRPRLLELRWPSAPEATEGTSSGEAGPAEVSLRRRRPRWPRRWA